MKDKLIKTISEYPIVIILCVFFIAFSVSAEGFLTGSNLGLILKYCNQYGFLAIGVTVLLINGHFDLSIGVAMGFAANIMSMLIESNVPLFFSILIPLLTGVVIGLINGLCVIVLKINSLVVTIMANVGLNGLTYLIVGTNSHSIGSDMSAFGRMSFLGISYITWIWIVMMVLVEISLRKTMHGRKTYAIGGNASSAENVGISLAKTTLFNFVFCSTMGAVGGVFQAIRLGATTPTLGYEDGRSMLVLTCVVLGGNKLTGGVGNMIRMFFGVFTMSVIQNGIDLLGVEGHWKTLTQGILLILIIIMDKYVDFTKIGDIRQRNDKIKEKKLAVSRI